MVVFDHLTSCHCDLYYKLSTDLALHMPMTGNHLSILLSLNNLLPLSPSPKVPTPTFFANNRTNVL